MTFDPDPKYNFTPKSNPAISSKPGFLELSKQFSILEAKAFDRFGNLLWEDKEHNLVTDAGRTFLATQGYSTSPGANGANYIGLSADALSETTTSTALSTEIASNGFSRAQGTVALPSGLATTTVTDNPLTNVATTINVASTANMQTGSLLLIESELILVGTVASTTQLTGCTRAMYGTTAASHVQTTTVTNVNTTVITHTFTATGSQTIQKGALFNAASTGTMAHVAAFTASRTLAATDTLQVTFYIMVG